MQRTPLLDLDATEKLESRVIATQRGTDPIPPARVRRIPARQVNTAGRRALAPLTRGHAVGPFPRSRQGQEVEPPGSARRARFSNSSNSSPVTTCAGFTSGFTVPGASPSSLVIAVPTHDAQGSIALQPSNAASAHIAHDPQPMPSNGAGKSMLTRRVELCGVRAITHTLSSSHLRSDLESVGER